MPWGLPWVRFGSRAVGPSSSDTFAAIMGASGPAAVLGVGVLPVAVMCRGPMERPWETSLFRPGRRSFYPICKAPGYFLCTAYCCIFPWLLQLRSIRYCVAFSGPKIGTTSPSFWVLVLTLKLLSRDLTVLSCGRDLLRTSEKINCVLCIGERQKILSYVPLCYNITLWLEKKSYHFWKPISYILKMWTQPLAATRGQGNPVVIFLKAQDGDTTGKQRVTQGGDRYTCRVKQNSQVSSALTWIIIPLGGVVSIN